jgi:hypothetical protein
MTPNINSKYKATSLNEAYWVAVYKNSYGLQLDWDMSSARLESRLKILRTEVGTTVLERYKRITLLALNQIVDVVTEFRQKRVSTNPDLANLLA